MPVERRKERDRFHLMLLSIFYYIASGITLLGVLLGAFYLFLGWLLENHPGQLNQAGSQPPVPLELMFSIVGGAVAVGSVVLAGLFLLSARGIVGRKWIVLSYIAAGIVCLSIPVGTALGIYTFIVFARPGVRDHYATEHRDSV